MNLSATIPIDNPRRCRTAIPLMEHVERQRIGAISDRLLFLFLDGQRTLRICQRIVLGITTTNRNGLSAWLRGCCGCRRSRWPRAEGIRICIAIAETAIRQGERRDRITLSNRHVLYTYGQRCFLNGQRTVDIYYIPIRNCTLLHFDGIGTHR